MGFARLVVPEQSQQQDDGQRNSQQPQQCSTSKAHGPNSHFIVVAVTSTRNICTGSRHIGGRANNTLSGKSESRRNLASRGAQAAMEPRLAAARARARRSRSSGLVTKSSIPAARQAT